MRFLAKRAETIGLLLFGLLGLITAVELAVGQRSLLDIAGAVAVAAVAICLFASLRSVKDSPVVRAEARAGTSHPCPAPT